MRRFRFDEQLRFESGAVRLIGVDEAGRGPLAGPVVAAAVLLPEKPDASLKGVRDSKKLTPARRRILFDAVRSHAARWSVGWAGPREVDRCNILQATFLAMQRALHRLGPVDAADLIVVDGNRVVPGIPTPQRAVVSGDDKSLSVACASVVAKVVRDRWLFALARRHPEYGFERHKGYGTADHMRAIERVGPCPEHRMSFLSKLAQRSLPL
ncbi:MAG: ribonuclease HII [Elusimicrobia bacterium CG1_02_63_36]|nr:MAG: ribonuclease HII [Elusimicrobia bacterium CG1_02_63_36]